MGNIIDSNNAPGIATVNFVTTNNVTGDGTSYTVIFNTVNFSKNITYNSSTGIGTISISGNYLLSLAVDTKNLTSSFTIGILNFIINTSTVYPLTECNPASALPPTPTYLLVGNKIISLNSGDTFWSTVILSGGTKTASVNGESYYSLFRIF